MQRKSPRAAMTLVELMVAVTLSAMLLSALVGVLSGVSRHAKLADRFDEPVWPSRVVELVRRDLVAADSIWSEGKGVRMRSSPPTYQLSNAGHRVIEYRCTTLSNGQQALLRIDGEVADVLAIGPRQLIVERLDASGNPQPLPPTPGPVPIQVRVWVFGDDQENPMLVSDLIVR